MHHFRSNMVEGKHPWQAFPLRHSATLNPNPFKIILATPLWMVLLQSVLTGKTREVYSALSVEQSSQYDHVKQVVLKAYKLVTEAYRQNFRKCRKYEKQTYTEFAHTKEALFDRWCTSKEVAKEYEKLRQMILVEEFKSCLPDNVKTYIEEQKADNLHKLLPLPMTTH